MRNSNKFLVISNGQLTNSSIWPSVSAFASVSTQYSWFGKLSYPLYWCTTALRYAYDLCIGGQIDAYKTGKMDTDKFEQFLQSQFAGTQDQLKEAWNAMCTIDQSNERNINALIGFLESGQDEKAIIISGTNPLQFEHIQNQIKDKCKGYEALLNSGKIIHSLSFEKRTLDMQALAETALKGVCEASDIVYSLHNKVGSVNLGLDVKINFTCDPFNPSKAQLVAHLTKAEQVFNGR